MFELGLNGLQVLSLLWGTPREHLPIGTMFIKYLQMANTGIRMLFLPRFTINYEYNTFIYNLDLRGKAALLSLSQCISAKINLLKDPISTAQAFKILFWAIVFLWFSNISGSLLFRWR